MRVTQAVQKLYEDRILSKKGVVQALLSLKLDSRELQEEFGFKSFTEFIGFFSDSVNQEIPDTQVERLPEEFLEEEPVNRNNTPWTVEDAIAIINARESTEQSATQVGATLNRSKDSVNGIFRRIWNSEHRFPSDLWRFVMKAYDSIFNELSLQRRDIGLTEEEFKSRLFSNTTAEKLIDRVIDEYPGSYNTADLYQLVKLLIVDEYCVDRNFPVVTIILTSGEDSQ